MESDKLRGSFASKHYIMPTAGPKLTTFHFQIATYKTTSVSIDTDVVLFLSGSLLEMFSPTDVNT